MFRRLRIAILLLVLLFVALNTYFDRVYSTDWDSPLRIAIFPINGDGSAITERYIGALQGEYFSDTERFFGEQALRYGVVLDRPVRLSVAAPVRELPPRLDPGAGPISALIWSLRTRYWAWRVPVYPAGAKPDIRLFVLYHDPELSASLPHSVGLQKGLYALVHAFADREMDGANATVIAHELLHTLGATDKYHPATNQPLHPDGFAEPARQPLYPQSVAELMGGRIPLSPDESRIPDSLRKVTIGPATAAEIGWRGR